MPVVLKEAAQPVNDLLKALIRDFNRYNSLENNDDKMRLISKTINDFIVPALQGNDEVHNFDRTIGNIDFNMIDVPDSFYSVRLQKYLQLQRFLYEIRKRFMEQRGITGESEYILKQKQNRIVSPGEKAFEPMGNNKLDIQESSSSYSLIVD